MVMKTRSPTIPELLRRTGLASMPLAVMLAISATPAQSAQGIPWQDLSREEQSVLAKQRPEWSSLSPERQQKLLNGARRYLQLPPDKRKAVERKFSQYEKMSPGERKKLRDKYNRQKQTR